MLRRHATFRYLLTLGLSICAFNCLAQQASDAHAPESSHHDSKEHIKPPLKPAPLAKDYIVVAAHPEASRAGFNVLEGGGNAIDAMVAVQTVLGLVEPQSSGLGGGAFLLYYDAEKQHITSFDGRETTPLDSPSDLLLKADMSPMKFFDAVVGGRSVGTPGTVKLMSDVHKRYGSRKWSELLSPAIELASSGFQVSPRLANAIAKDEKNLKKDPSTHHYFFPNGSALQVGAPLKNSDYAATLSLLAQHGGDYFYNSEISTAIAAKVASHPNRGYLKQEDFSNYKIIERPTTCDAYHSFEVCGMGPPSSGAIAVSQTLGILENFELRKRKPSDPITWQLIAEASRLAFADRGLYVADPDFTSLPEGLLDDQYLKRRAELIKPGQAASQVSAGQPDLKPSKKLEPGFSPEQPSTSHFVIVDKQGNIVSMTSTIENGFGSRLMVKGFLLNNELTDFSFKTHNKGQVIANRVEPGKRPRSSMAPTIVFQNDAEGQRRPYVALGSPGGSRIIPYVSNSLIGILDWQQTLQQTFQQPHIVNRFGTMDLEKNTQAESLEQDFIAMGYKTSIRELNSGLHGVRFTEGGMQGAADPRREGLVLGR